MEPGSALGPGKADLLQAISDTGSIAAAGRRLGMSYKRAWQLVEILNAMFAEPLVDSSRGGPAGGGASLTRTGNEVLDLYRRIQDESARAGAKPLSRLQELMKPANGGRTP